MVPNVIADGSAFSWWVSPPEVLEGTLHGMGALLALVAMAAAILCHLVLRLAHGRRETQGAPNGGEIETVRLTKDGPFVPGSPARLTVLGRASASVFDGLFEGIDRQWIAVTLPVSESTYVKPGMVAEMIVPVGGAAFRCTMIMRDHSTHRDWLRLYFDRPEWVERVQRRGHFRVPIGLPTTVVRIDERSPDHETVPAVLNNLSGSGLSVSAPIQPPPGSILRIRLPLPGLEHAMFEVRVKQARRARVVGAASWHMGCEFLWMGEATREAIVRACVEQERAIRNRRRLGL